MKIQSPAILAIGLVVSLTSAIAGSFTPTSTLDRARHQTASIVESRPVAGDLTRRAADHPHFTEAERLTSDR